MLYINFFFFFYQTQAIFNPISNFANTDRNRVSLLMKFQNTYDILSKNFIPHEERIRVNKSILQHQFTTFETFIYPRHLPYDYLTEEL